jgi:SET domain-containing protein
MNNHWTMTDQEIDALIAANQHHPNVEWRRIPGKGRGVFARHFLPKGSIAEWSPVTVYSERCLPADQPQDNRLLQYVFTFGTEPGREKGSFWGLLSLYNHSSTPNVIMDDGPVADTIAAVALRDINPGEELCFDYGQIWFDEI